MQTTQPQVKQKSRWIIDTDPGCDDMMAILYLLNQPDAEVEFISLAEGNCKMKDVEVNIKKILKMWGKGTVKVYKGSERQLVQGAENAYDYHYEDGLGGIKEIMDLDVGDFGVVKDGTSNTGSNDTNTGTTNTNSTTSNNDHSLSPPTPFIDPAKKAAIEIVRLVNKFPNQISLLALAPTTNISLAYQLDPSISTKFKEIITMGGSYYFNGNITASSEFNFYHDYIAASLLFSRFSNILVMGWEPTKQALFRVEYLEIAKKKAVERFGGCNEGLYFFVDLILRKYSKYKGGSEICDLYAIIAYFNPLCVREFVFAKERVVVDSEICKGALLRREVVSGGKLGERGGSSNSGSGSNDSSGSNNDSSGSSSSGSDSSSSESSGSSEEGSGNVLGCVRNDGEMGGIGFDVLMSEYFKQGKEYLKGYNIYVEECVMDIIIEEFSWIFRP